MTAQTVGTPPQQIDINVAAGEPIDFTVPVLDADDDVVDVTGWTGLAQIRPHAGGALLHTLDCATSADGVQVTADSDDTAAWAAWRDPMARWDLWVVPTSEDPRPLARGRVFVRSPITEV
jgi:hypothetical protein